MEQGSAWSGHGAGGTAGIGMSVGVSSAAVPSTRCLGLGGGGALPVLAMGVQVAAGCHRLCCEARQDVTVSSRGRWQNILPHSSVRCELCRRNEVKLVGSLHSCLLNSCGVVPAQLPWCTWHGACCTKVLPPCNLLELLALSAGRTVQRRV